MPDFCHADSVSLSPTEYLTAFSHIPFFPVWIRDSIFPLLLFSDSVVTHSLNLTP